LDRRSHATYYFLAAGELAFVNLRTFLLINLLGCYMSINDYTTAQLLFDSVPSLLEKRKINGKDLPTEVLIKKKCQSSSPFSICLLINLLS
jgi:hypothetical protein